MCYGFELINHKKPFQDESLPPLLWGGETGKHSTNLHYKLQYFFVSLCSRDVAQTHGRSACENIAQSTPV